MQHAPDTTSAVAGPRRLEPGDDAGQALAHVAATDPDRPLLEIDGRTTTYAEADARVDAAACRLVRELGRGGGAVGLRTDDLGDLLVASLAVLRAGMTAVSVDPSAPPELAADLLADVDAILLIDGTAEPLADAGVRSMTPAELVAEPADPGWAPLAPAEVAAISFTSGSTGRPKGIVIPPSMRPSVSMSMLDSAQLGGERTRFGLLNVGSAGPAEMGCHIIPTLGATAVVYPLRAKGVVGLAEWLLASRIQSMYAVPTVFRQATAAMPDDVVFGDLRTILMSGEAVTWEDVVELRRHLPPEATIVNMFGQTETLGLAAYPIGSDVPAGAGALPVGYPLPHRTLRIVDEDGRDVADGQVGELLVEDAGVALGYWRRPELTARTFTDLGDGRRRVRTGDRVRRRPDGMLEHAGRADHVVKVNGVRIELGQVEAALLELESVTEAAAGTYVDRDGRTRLAGYVVCEGDVTVSPAGARAALARSLPTTMLPTVVVPLAELPQLPGGKVDRRALPEPERAVPSDGGPPRGETQEALAGLFAAVLGVEAVGADDDFFALGGDSLAAVEVLAGITALLGVELPPSSLVEAPTVASLATLIELDPGTWPTIVPVRPEGSLTPVVVFHALKGEVFFAAGLAEHLDPDRPVLGIRADPEPQDATISAMAARYVAELRRARPHGPYLLYGFSFGAYVAFEAARLLVEAGEEVERLFLIDVLGPAANLRRRRFRGLVPELRAAGRFAKWRVIERLPRHRRAPRGASDRSVWVDAEAALQAGGPIPRELRLAAAMVHHGKLLAAHRIEGVLDVPVTLVLAADGRIVRYGGGPSRGWQPHVRTRVETARVPGTHTPLGMAAYIGPAAEVVERWADRG